MSDPIIGYCSAKSKSDDKEVAVTMEIIGETNMGEEEVMNVLYAEHTTKKVKVIKVIGKNNKSYDEAYITLTIFKFQWPREIEILFKVGEIVEVSTLKKYGDLPWISFYLLEECLPEYYARVPFTGIRERWYVSTGRLAARDEMIDGIENGKSQVFHHNGLLGWEGNRKNGHFDGDFVQWHPNGIKKLTCFFSDGSVQGTVTEWHDNGALKIICVRKSGMFNGPYKSWHENGKPHEECTYENNIKIGLSRTWHKNGERNEEYTHNSDGLKVGKYNSYYSNGKPKVECEYVCVDGLGYSIGRLENKYNGPYVEFYENGNEKKKCTYCNGRLVGLYLEWHENGNKKVECTYDSKYGDGIGKHTEWHDNGIKSFEFTSGACDYVRWNYDGTRVFQ